ncbi:uncharacterized protein DUF983 [Flavobacterium aciduliphilum]|uniref:Uncharacterized protein DUF983 n=2 Tax=Flavobacterium aciduliphilum TaxID=1101402 RepID=A0A328YDH4_9FLAO|nr:uncharacterized protein DUF983 [Flavobacterium aciduliphilum]
MNYLCRKFLQMLKKGSTLYSILTGTCPKCNEESMYEVKNPYKLTTLYKMHDTCSHCHTQYKIEPSFFYGAMYVSYGLTVAFGVAIFIILHVFLNQDILNSFIGIIVGILLLMPITARLARNIYINMFIRYDKNWKQNA